MEFKVKYLINLTRFAIAAIILVLIVVIIAHSNGFMPPDLVLLLAAFSMVVLIAALVVEHRQATLRHQALLDRIEQLSSLNHNLSRVNNFVQAIVFNTDTSSVLRAAGEVAMQITQADRLAIMYQLGENPPRFNLAYDLNLLPEHRAWLEQHVETVTDVSHAPMVISDVTLPGTPESALAEAALGAFRAKVEIPMRSGNTPVGLLILYDQRPHEYTSSELELLETLTFQITAALDSTELVKTLEVYASEQAQLVHLSRTSTATLDLSKMVETVLGLLRHMLDVSHVWLGLADTNKQVVEFYTGQGQLQHTAVRLEVVQPYLTFDPEPRHFAAEDVPLEVRTIDTLPVPIAYVATASLVVGGEAIGLLMLGLSQPLSTTENRVFELAVNQIAVQLHNAQRYQFIQEALDRRLRQLALIEDIARQISSALHVEQLIGNVLDAAIKATQADMAAVALVTEMGDFEIIGREQNSDSWQMRYLKRSKSAGIMGRVAQTHQKVIVPDNHSDPDYLGTLTPGRYHSSLVVPLLKDEQVIGVLDVESTRLNFFKGEHAEFIESLAGHAVISIQNARLLQERQRQIDVLTQLRRLSLRLPSNSDYRTVVHEVLQSALMVLQGEHAVLFGLASRDHYQQSSSAAYRELMLLGSLRRTEDGFTSVSTPLPEAVVQCALDTGETQIVLDIATSPFFEGYAYLDTVSYRAMIAAPIKHGSTAQEVLCVTFAHPKAKGDEALNILELLLIQAAGHLENALLYERVIAGNDRLRTFLDSSSDGIILLDAQGILVQANISAERLLGIDLSDYVGADFANRLLRVLETDDSNTDAHEGLRQMARILRLEPERVMRRRFELRRRGQPSYIEEVSSPVMDAQNRAIGRLLILRDVTEEKQLEDYRNEITNMIVHDLRSPLSAIYSSMSYGKLLLEDPETATDAGEIVVPVLDVALNSATNLLTLVDSLLDIAKLETRSMPLRKRAMALPPLIEEVVTSLRTVMETAELQLDLRIPQDLPDVYADEGKIRRVIVNLLDNAHRFAPQGGTVWVEAVVLQADAKVLVRVADSGKGIPLDERERVFEKFRQISTQSPMRGRRGSGLGLTLCKLVLEAHGERIWVEAQGPLSGASFAFTLPIFMGQREE